MSPTHFPDNVNHRPDILDIAILKNVNLGLRSIETLQELDSDHRPVILALGPRSGPSDPDQPVPTKTITDWGRLEKRLKSTSSVHLDSIPDTIVSVADTVTAIDSLTSHVQSVVNECSRQVPEVDEHRWKLPDDVRELLTDKNAAIRAYDSFPNEANRIHMRTLQRTVRKRISEMREARWDKLLDKIEPTHQAFWQLQRKLKSDQCAVIPPLNRPNQQPAFDDDDKSEVLADSLEAQCTPSTLPVDQAHLSKVDAEVKRRTALPPSDESDDPLPLVTVEEVRMIVKDLKPRKAPGSDGITNKVVKYFPAPLIVLMTAIFNAALSNNLFPQSWKQATVIGFPKPGKPKCEPTSYRPISLLNVFGKIYERLIYIRLKDYAESHKLLPDEQFGFRAKHSCIHQLHRIVEHISTGFMSKMKTGILFFDVAKAFDKVWHDGLIYKLYQFQVPDRLVLIIRDFLSNRSFRYRVEGVLSSPHQILAGVPQGSVLSPLLFALYTSDIPKSGKSKLALFADDTAIYYTGRSLDCITRSLQTSANALGAWFRKWRIEVNPDKSAAVLFSRTGAEEFLPQLRAITMFGKPIPWELQAKYLGVTLDHKLSFRPHIKIVRDRAAFAVGRLFPITNARSKLSLNLKIRLYTTCIRPIMTYASVVFAHVKYYKIRRMQTLQNRFLRKATGAPWFVRNLQLHIDLRVPTIRQFMKRASKRYFESTPNHPNPLVVSSADYRPSQINKIRRPRHALLRPDDRITVAQESNRHTSTLRRARPPRYRPRRRGPRPSRNVSSCPPRPLLEPARAEPVALNSSFNNKVTDMIQLVPSCPPSNALSRGSCPAGDALSAVLLSL